MNQKIEELKQKQSKLQFHMENAIKERDSIQGELDILIPQVEKQFGTSDVDKLEEISIELQSNIDKSIQELSALGVNL